METVMRRKSWVKRLKGTEIRFLSLPNVAYKKRERTFIHDLRPSQIRKELEHSLSRLNIEQLDLYQCHWPDPKTPIEATLEEMLKMQSEGKINNIGVSNFDLPLLEKALRIAPVVSIQVHYSLLERSVEESHLLQFCKKRGVGVMTYGSLGGGLLTGKYKNPPTFPKKDARRFFYPFYKGQEWR